MITAAGRAGTRSVSAIPGKRRATRLRTNPRPKNLNRGHSRGTKEFLKGNRETRQRAVGRTVISWAIHHARLGRQKKAPGRKHFGSFKPVRNLGIGAATRTATSFGELTKAMIAPPQSPKRGGHHAPAPKTYIGGHTARRSPAAIKGHRRGAENTRKARTLGSCGWGVFPRAALFGDARAEALDR